MMIGARTAVWAKYGRELDDKIHFVKDFTFNRYGEIKYDPGFSYVEDFVKVNPAHSITWLASNRYIQPETGDKSLRVLLEYDLNKNIIDFWNVNTYSGVRTITTSMNTRFVRWCIENGFEDKTYLFDNTSRLYIVKNRTILYV